MAISQLTLYNSALLLIGQRELVDLVEDRPSKDYLDNAYSDPSAIDVCLELTKPRFASKVVKLESPSVSAEHGLDSVHTLPDEYVTLVGVFSDEKLDQPVSRYLIEDRTLVCEYDTVYLRFTANDRAMTSWTPMFAQLVSTYLARTVCFKSNPDIYEAVNALFNDTVESVITLEGEKEPEKRSSATTVTLTTEWRKIYNDSLLIMGLEEITSNTDDSNRRTKLDRTLDSGAVETLLEETGWQFALTSTKITYDPSADPDWGYQYAFQKPSDIHRLDGIYADDYMNRPVKRYQDEQSYWFSDYQTMYVQYVSSDFLNNPSLWPTFFKRLVAARMARDAAASLRVEGADLDLAIGTYDGRLNDAKGNDAVQSPPRRIRSGNWVKAFRGGNAYRNRPGDY